MPSKVLFLIPYPLKEAPSQRFRFEQYFDLLRQKGFTIHIQSFLVSQNWRLFFKSGAVPAKSVLLISGFLRRFLILFRAHRFDYVFIHREALPLGPPIFEWILAKVLRARIIYDFDDAIWLTDRGDENRLIRVLKWRQKVRQICRWAFKVSCGNEYLCDYARAYNHAVAYNPTTVDTDNVHSPSRTRTYLTGSVITIGWTGSHTTTKYLTSIENVLRRVTESFRNIEILIIADEKPGLQIPFTFREWNEATEVTNLEHIDIGIMPLPDDDWAKGKCGFKAIQYLSLNIPCVLSPVGVNTRVVTQGVSGFFCSSEDEWFEALSSLIQNGPLRKAMGEAGRNHIIRNYSVSANARNFLSLFENS